MRILKDDIFNCTENIIVHQTNCMGVMGSGLAKQVKEKYPEVFNAYYHYCKTNKAEDIFGTALICEADDGKYIANVFGQINYGKDKQYTDYDALENALNEVKQFAIDKNLSVAVPYKIGCGNGGGNWTIVSKLVRKIFTKLPSNIYKKV